MNESVVIIIVCCCCRFMVCCCHMKGGKEARKQGSKEARKPVQRNNTTHSNGTMDLIFSLLLSATVLYQAMFISSNFLPH